MNLPSEGDLFTPKSATLDDLLPDIGKHKIALPNFQRPWVWEPEMVRDLLISVAYRYPAGSLLTMPINHQGFALRPFEGTDESWKNTPTLMILDGQQRLTSLYQSLHRPDGSVQYKGTAYYFYLDVALLMEDPDGINAGDPYFDKALFYVSRDKRDGRKIRYERLQPKYELTTPEQELQAGALPLRYVFESDGLTKWKEDYINPLANDSLKAYQELNRKWDSLVHAWIRRIRTYRFPIVELDEDMPLNAICHIFEKVNSTGVSLSVFDLCTAILWSQGFHLNEKWAAFRQTLATEKVLQMQPLNGTFFLQSLSLLDSLDRKRAEPAKNIAVACRKQDLMALNRAAMEKWWDVLVKGYREADRFMMDHGIIAERILPYSTLIVPLAAVFADLIYRKGEAYVGAAWSKVAQWYWCSTFSQRYSSQIETIAARDFEQMIEWIDGGQVPDAIRTFYFRSDALQEVTSIRNAIYRGVLCLLAQEGTQDFGGGSKLSTALFRDTAQDHHHIFPKAALDKLGIQDKRIDSIANKALIGAATNRSIGGHLPSEYLQTLETRIGKDPSGKSILPDILRSHKVDPDLLRSDNWVAYFTDRRERLRNLIQSACGGNIQPFSDAPIVDEVEEEE